MDYILLGNVVDVLARVGSEFENKQDWNTKQHTSSSSKSNKIARWI